MAGRDGGEVNTNYEKTKQKYFCGEGWTNGNIAEIAKPDLPDKCRQIGACPGSRRWK
jgi:hypothetical protein